MLRRLFKIPFRVSGLQSRDPEGSRVLHGVRRKHPPFIDPLISRSAGTVAFDFTTAALISFLQLKCWIPSVCSSAGAGSETSLFLTSLIPFLSSDCRVHLFLVSSQAFKKGRLTHLQFLLLYLQTRHCSCRAVWANGSCWGFGEDYTYFQE